MPTWTYFTSYLDGSRPITTDERDEIYDQMTELFTLCSTGHSFTASVMTAIKDSNLITDLARVEKAPSSDWSGKLAAIIPAISASFSNYAAAHATAIAGEGLSQAQFDAITLSNLDDHRWWNYYKRLIDALTCLTCTIFPTINCRSKSASKTKCGHAEWPGFVSTPPKRYLTLTLSGTLTAETHSDSDCSACEDKITYGYSGTCNYSRPACSETNSGLLTTTVYPVDCSTPNSPTTGDVCDVDAGVGYDESFSATVHTVTGQGCHLVGGTTYANYLGSATATLSNEYTTALLETDVNDDLAAASFGAWGASCPDAEFDQTSDELTITKTQIEVKFLLPTSRGAGYKFRFQIWETLESGFSGAIATVCIEPGASDTEYVYGLIDAPGTPGVRFVTNTSAFCTACP